jgi:hypothetical protein
MNVAKVSVKIPKQLNGKLNYVSCDDENEQQNITAEHFLKTVKRLYIYPSIEDTEAVLVSERNNPGLKRLSNFI